MTDKTLEALTHARSLNLSSDELSDLESAIDDEYRRALFRERQARVRALGIEAGKQVRYHYYGKKGAYAIRSAEVVWVDDDYFVRLRDKKVTKLINVTPENILEVL